MSEKQAQGEWLGRLFERLEQVDSDSVNFVRSQKVRINFSNRGAHVSAIWTIGMRIYLNARYFSVETSPDDPYILGVVMHEIRHLQQGFFTALSVYGELDAWQLGFRVQHQLSGKPYPANLMELMALPLVFNRDVLQRARVLMQIYASKKYRVDLLPLYPLGREIKYHFGL